jgi:hypothetical protein
MDMRKYSSIFFIFIYVIIFIKLDIYINIILLHMENKIQLLNFYKKQYNQYKYYTLLIS